MNIENIATLNQNNRNSENSHQNSDISNCFSADNNLYIFNFYSFVPIKELEATKQDLDNLELNDDNKFFIDDIKCEMKNFCIQNHILGTIILAKEGINGALTGKLQDLKKFNNEKLEKYFRSSNLKFAITTTKPFSKLKVKSKEEIVTMKVNLIDIEDNKGKYIKPNEWDSKISEPNSILIDVRNDYECLVGSFAGAINPKTENFRDFPKWVQDNMEIIQGKKVYMFCTGGIRCEKSTVLIKNLGLSEVYHLEGGILDYLYQTKNQNNKWQGKCFVFDDREAVDEKDYLFNETKNLEDKNYI